jgi:lactoylglutathione lyase
VRSAAPAITAITLFVDDLDLAKSFYNRVFDIPVHFEDADSAVFLFGSTMVNLLRVDAAVELIAPAQVGDAAAGPRAQLTLTVDDVDDTCALLVGRGVQLLNGPMDRPWGIRTAAFTDPAGHVWEIAH